MLIKLNSIANVGLLTTRVEIEVDVASQGFPGMTIVGQAGKSVEEARERVKTAIKNSGYSFPPKKITINLAPADLPKEGGAFDLPMAIGILVASEQLEIQPETLEKTFFCGELSLDGSLRPTRGVLLAALLAKKEKIPELVVPIYNANEAAAIQDVKIYPARGIKEVADHYLGNKRIEPIKPIDVSSLISDSKPNGELAEVIGQEQAKRALIISAAGGHNLLLWGPPGTGKTMLARCLPDLLPDLTTDEALEVTRIYSVAGMLDPGESLVRRRPFRSPHKSISAAGMIGGGTNPLPGEISLAHLGVLFLDEMAEFPRNVLESLRQPLEDGVVSIVRSKAKVEYPAYISLVGAVNPCPCGYLGHPKVPCGCSESQIRNYHARLSGPILDRIDMHVQVPAVDLEKLSQNFYHQKYDWNKSSMDARNEVEKAREIQSKRFSNSGIFCNSQMKNKLIREFCRLDCETEVLLNTAAEKWNLSTRVYFRLIKVARTIADLSGSDKIQSPHMAESLQYRQQYQGFR